MCYVAGPEEGKKKRSRTFRHGGKPRSSGRSGLALFVIFVLVVQGGGGGGPVGFGRCCGMARGQSFCSRRFGPAANPRARQRVVCGQIGRSPYPTTFPVNRENFQGFRLEFPFRSRLLDVGRRGPDAHAGPLLGPAKQNGRKFRRAVPRVPTARVVAIRIPGPRHSGMLGNAERRG